MSQLDLNMEDYKMFKENPDEGPVVMLNLLKFKRNGGEKKYGQYAAIVSKMVNELGGRIVYAGKAKELLTGDERWDAVLLIEYPSRKAFLKMIRSEEYQKAHVYREEGLERAVLYATQMADLRNL